MTKPWHPCSYSTSLAFRPFWRQLLTEAPQAWQRVTLRQILVLTPSLSCPGSSVPPDSAQIIEHTNNMPALCAIRPPLYAAAMRNTLHLDQGSEDNDVSEVIDLDSGSPQEEAMITSQKTSSMPISGTDMPLSATEESTAQLGLYVILFFKTPIKKKCKLSSVVWQMFTRVTIMESEVQKVFKRCSKRGIQFMNSLQRPFWVIIWTPTAEPHKKRVQAALSRSAGNIMSVDAVHPACDDIQYRFEKSCAE